MLESELASFALWLWLRERQFSCGGRESVFWGTMANITADGEEGQTAYVGVVEVDAPIASRASGDESVPTFDTDRTAGSTGTLG